MADPTPVTLSPVPEELLDKIQENVVNFHDSMKKRLGVEIAFDAKSVEWVDGYINRIRTDFPAEHVEGVIAVIGAYLGECLNRAYHGNWQYVNGELGVVLDVGGTPIYGLVFEQVQKQFRAEADESIFTFYSVIPLLAQIADEPNEKGTYT